MKGEKKSKSSHLDKSDQFRTEVESKMIDMDGPELLQFAMIFVQGAMKKSQVWQKFAGTHFSRREAAVPEHTILPQEKVCEELLQLLTLTNVVTIAYPKSTSWFQFWHVNSRDLYIEELYG